MTRNSLGSWGSLRECQVSNECAHCNSNHDRTVIRHKQKPKAPSQQPKANKFFGRHLHDEEAIEHLNGI
jgi:hypothetical protein